MMRNARFGVTSNVIYPEVVNETLVQINESVVEEKVSTLNTLHFKPLILIHKDSPRHLDHGLLIEIFNQLQRV